MTELMARRGAKALVAIGLLATCATACGTVDADPIALPTPKTDESMASDSYDSLADYGVSCDVSVGTSKLSVTLRNATGVDVRFLAWNTPWDQQGDALHIVSSDTREVAPYVGPVLNRKLDESSYLVVPAGGEVSSTYSFDGRYTTLPGSGEVGLRNEPLLVEIAGRAVKLNHGCRAKQVKLGLVEHGETQQSLLEPYPSCSAQQKASLQRMIDGAMKAAELAAGELQRGNSAAKARWFRDQSLHPRSAYTRMLAEDEYVRCGGSSCEDNLGVVMSYGYDEKLYICAPLYSMTYASTLGYEQQVGVMIHELAHLVDQDGGSIVDWDNPSCAGWPDNECYGYENALSLATHCTECSQRNAENYKHFAMEAFMRGAVHAAIF
jgi:hypothetical protein